MYEMCSVALRGGHSTEQQYATVADAVSCCVRSEGAWGGRGATAACNVCAKHKHLCWSVCLCGKQINFNFQFPPTTTVHNTKFVLSQSGETITTT
jgi:hypothetical protein